MAGRKRSLSDLLSRNSVDDDDSIEGNSSEGTQVNVEGSSKKERQEPVEGQQQELQETENMKPKEADGYGYLGKLGSPPNLSSPSNLATPNGCTIVETESEPETRILEE